MQLDWKLDSRMGSIRCDVSTQQHGTMRCIEENLFAIQYLLDGESSNRGPFDWTSRKTSLLLSASYWNCVRTVRLCVDAFLPLNHTTHAQIPSYYNIFHFYTFLLPASIHFDFENVLHFALLTSCYFANEQHIAALVVRFDTFRFLTTFCFIDDWTIGRHWNHRKRKREINFLQTNIFIKSKSNFVFYMCVKCNTVAGAVYGRLQRKQSNLVAQSIMIYLLIKLIHHNFTATINVERRCHRHCRCTNTRLTKSFDSP